MKARTCASALLCTCLLAILPSAESGLQKPSQPPVQVPRGTWRIVSGNACVDFTPGLYSGDFFTNLKRVDTPSGPRFYRGGKVVTEMPAAVVLELIGTIDECVPPKEPPPVKLTPLPVPEFLWDSKLTAEWEDGSRTSPVQIIRYRSYPPMPMRETGSATWEFELIIASCGIPLKDSLKLSFVDSHGEVIATFHLGL